MEYLPIVRRVALITTVSLCLASRPGMGQEERPLPVTPLTPEVLTLLANEISGQIIYNNEVALAGAPWLRDENEFAGTMYESQKIHDLVRGYGIETTKLEQLEKDGEFEYPFEGEFWMVEPEKKLIARLEADTALVARSS